jgi:tetratricopeptide (TPR) repeat protein
MVEGLVCIIEGRYSEALAKLKEAEKAPGKRTAIVAMSALAYQAIGQEDRSVRGFADLQHLQCEDFTDYLFRGWALSERSAEEALSDLKEARRLRPASHVVMMIYARVLRSLSENLANPRDALTTSEEVLKCLDCIEAYLGKSPGTKSEKVLTHLIASGRCVELADASGSEVHLKAAEEIANTLDVNSAEALLARANLFRQTGNREQILKDFESVTGRVHEHVAFSNCCATLFYRNGHYEKALKIYDGFDKAGAETGVYAFRLFAQLGEASKEDLQRQCQEMFKNRPRDQQTVQRYSDWIICRLLGETELAEAAAEGFIQGARAMRKDVWLNVGEFMKGRISEDDLIKPFDGRRFEVAHGHFLIAMDRLSRGDRTGACQSFQKVIDTNVPRYYVSWWSEAFLERLEDPNWISWLPNSIAPESED